MSCRSREEWRQEVARLRRAGLEVTEIARRLKVPQAVVGNTLHTARVGVRSGTAAGRVGRNTLPDAGSVRSGSGANADHAKDVSLKKRHFAQTVKDMKTDVERDLAGLQRIEDAAWEQFAVSCRPRESVTKQDSEDADNQASNQTRRRESVGDVRFLNCALRCISQRQKLRHLAEVLMS